MNTRYSRQIMLPEIGEEGQRRIALSTVVIAGLGGLGAPVATYLAGAGVGTLRLVDPDVVSLSNLQRQVLYTLGETGKSKAISAARRLSAQNPEISITPYCTRLDDSTAGEILQGADLVMDCTDSFAARRVIDRICADRHIPWVHGAIGAFSGLVTVLGLPPRCVRYSDIYGTGPDTEPEGVAGVIGAVPGVVGAWQAVEAIKVLAGFGSPASGKIISINLLNNSISTLNISE